MESIPFCLDEELNKLATQLSMKVEEKGLQFKINVDAKVPRYLVGDPLRLGQILMNFTTNAIKFTQKGSITINVATNEQANLHFSVTDTGIGISEKNIPYLFDAFTQADNSTSRKFGGTGLGLAICKQLSKMMGGEIWAESQLDQGSTFHFRATFGVQIEQNKTNIKETDTTITNINDVKILLVEDNFINQQVAQEIMLSEGLVVHIADSGKKALAMLAETDFDAILMDVQMPGMDGYETTQSIRETPQYQQLPIIAMTAHAMAGDREKCIAAGMNDYITKPIDEVQLFSTLRRWIQVDHPAKQMTSKPEIQLPGINTTIGLERLRGNSRLYYQLLQDFYRDFHDIVQKIKQVLQNGDFDTARSLLHNLKGSSGNLSIDNLYEASKAVETILKTKNEIAPEQFDSFETIVTEVMKTLATLTVEKSAKEELNREETDIVALTFLLPELAKLIDNGNPQVREKLPKFKACLSKDLQSLYEQLEQEIKNLNFDEALEILNEISSQLELSHYTKI